MNKKVKLLVVSAVAVAFVCEVCVLGILGVVMISYIHGTPPRIVQVAQALVASPTPLPTRTPKPTYTITPSPTSTAILLPTITDSPTNTPTKTPTKKTAATQTRAQTPARPTTVPTATAQYQFRVLRINCLHSGQSFVEGLVLENMDRGSGINGLKVRMSADPGGGAVDPDSVTEDHYLNDANFPQGNYPGYFNHTVNANGAAPGEVRYVWVVDGSGKALSNPADGKAKFDAGGGDTACWNVQVTFVKVQ